MSGSDLGLGQLCAIIAGLAFLLIEGLRLKDWGFAAVEAFRVWGFMAISLLTMWLAFQTSDPATHIILGLVSPIVAAIILNNSYLALRRLVGEM